jgi:hypothetical protein
MTTVSSTSAATLAAVRQPAPRAPLVHSFQPTRADVAPSQSSRCAARAPDDNCDGSFSTSCDSSCDGACDLPCGCTGSCDGQCTAPNPPSPPPPSRFAAAALAFATTALATTITTAFTTALTTAALTTSLELAHVTSDRPPARGAAQQSRCGLGLGRALWGEAPTKGFERKSAHISCAR